MNKNNNEDNKFINKKNHPISSDTRLLNARYESLIESIPNMVWSVDINDYSLMTFNSFMANYYLKYLNIELRPGLTPKEMLPSEELNQFWLGLYNRSAKGESFQIDYRMVTSNRTLNIVLNPMYIDHEMIGISVFTKDITERIETNHKLEVEMNKYKSLIEKTSDYVFLVDATNYDSILYNPAAKNFINKTYGVDIDNFKSAFDILPENGVEFWEKKFDEVKSKKHISFRVNTSASNSILDFHMNLIEYEKQQQIMVISKDVTKDVNYQEQLYKLNLKLKEQLVESIHAISKIGEIRDPYTAGHQKRVRQLCVAIATKLGLDHETIENIDLAALIHDIGKVYVPSEILNKPGHLSSIELELIKTHPKFGYEIVKDIGLPSDVGIMVLQHHERLDGSGYPFGIKKEGMIFGSCILAVADVIEAMSSHRPYRAALGVDVALKEIKDNRGTKYSAEVVDACLQVFTDGFQFDSVF